MTDITIIREIMDGIIPDDHPIIYQYIKGKVRSKESAVMRITGIIGPIFIGAYDISRVRGVARTFLKEKERDYTNGKITIKAIYN